MTRRTGSSQHAHDGHKLRRKFKRRAADSEAQIGEGVADMVEFKVQVNGHETTEKANRIQAWQGLSDWQLTDRFDKDRPVLLLPGSCGVGSTNQSSRLQDGGKS